jgi:hypothetical protein
MLTCHKLARTILITHVALKIKLFIFKKSMQSYVLEVNNTDCVNVNSATLRSRLPPLHFRYLVYLQWRLWLKMNNSKRCNMELRHYWSRNKRKKKYFNPHPLKCLYQSRKVSSHLYMHVLGVFIVYLFLRFA